MRKLLCPQCKIAGLYVKNERKERLLVYVSDEGEVVPRNLEENMEGFDLTIVYCLAWETPSPWMEWKISGCP